MYSHNLINLIKTTNLVLKGQSLVLTFYHHPKNTHLKMPTYLKLALVITICKFTPCEIYFSCQKSERNGLVYRYYTSFSEDSFLTNLSSSTEAINLLKQKQLKF